MMFCFCFKKSRTYINLFYTSVNEQLNLMIDLIVASIDELLTYKLHYINENTHFVLNLFLKLTYLK